MTAGGGVMSELFYEESGQKRSLSIAPDQEAVNFAPTFDGPVGGSLEVLYSSLTHDEKAELDSASRMSGSVNYNTTYRKPCNCAKSHCLKLYCECFARGNACDNCNCSNCMNNIIHDDARRRAIKLTLERNPFAFHPKIGENDRKHSKGCNCKRSGCLKNYCECYEAKINCSDLCRCQGCRNFENGCASRGNTQIESLPLGKQKSSYAQKKSLFCFPHSNPGNFQDGIAGGFVALPHATQAFGQSTEVTGELYPYEQCLGESIISTGFLSVEVAEAACSCMLAQLDETKQRDSSPSHQERVIIEEFGRCLEQILETAMKLHRESGYADIMNYPAVDGTANPDFITVLSSGENDVSHSSQSVYEADPRIDLMYQPSHSLSALPNMRMMNAHDPQGANFIDCRGPICNEQYGYAAHMVSSAIPNPIEDRYPIAQSITEANGQTSLLAPPIVEPYGFSQNLTEVQFPLEAMEYPQMQEQGDFGVTRQEGTMHFDPRFSLNHPTLEVSDPNIYIEGGIDGIAGLSAICGTDAGQDTSEQLLQTHLEELGNPVLLNRPTASEHISKVGEDNCSGADEEEVQTATQALLHAANDYPTESLAMAAQLELVGSADISLNTSGVLQNPMKQSNASVYHSPNGSDNFGTLGDGFQDLPSYQVDSGSKLLLKPEVAFCDL
ncbi:hypothetical protein CRM22_007071 [Opisthorchis felineus]|uniref:CRC domain-containing protein n=1 Tax=Opisthorchis felineus TaxID=147828 RepID=A0A4S2LHT8_OPIFE|nr:hypothetical protein CRM22_007071 [Opisthorchis felineus]